MGIFRRVSDIVSANLNDMVDRFEDPETMLKQAIREMEVCIEDATAAAAKAIASGKLLDKELADHEQAVKQWQGRAEEAVRAGDDDLARRSLRRRRVHDTLVHALRDQSSSAQQATQTLRRQIDGMKAKHAEAKRKLATLTARNKAAQARRRWQMAGTATWFRADAFTMFDRMRDKVELAEAEAEALIELDVNPRDELLGHWIAQESDAAIEAELAELKQKIR